MRKRKHMVIASKYELTIHYHFRELFTLLIKVLGPWGSLISVLMILFWINFYKISLVTKSGIIFFGITIAINLLGGLGWVITMSLFLAAFTYWVSKRVQTVLLIEPIGVAVTIGSQIKTYEWASTQLIKRDASFIKLKLGKTIIHIPRRLFQSEESVNSFIRPFKESKKDWH